jgi:pimeloyl-ACP methyl ester carboxylesterase
MKSIFLVAALSVAAVTSQGTAIGPPPGTLVDIGGRKLHAICSGAGAPTVILEAGASAFAIDWSLVQPAIAKTTRVCSYDRAGSGWSDEGPIATAARIAADLHALLAKLGEKPPYVLVGASAGGLYVRIYDHDYPGEVAGLVLVDPAHEDRLFTFFQGQAVAIASLTAEQLQTTTPSQPVRVPRRQPQTGAPFDRLPAALYKTRIALDTKLIASIPDTVPPSVVAESAEGQRAALALLHEISNRAEPALGDRPVVVLSRGVDLAPEARAVHASLGRLTRNFRHTVVDGAGHEVHLFQPDAVIQAIADVVTSTKTGDRLRLAPR